MRASSLRRDAFSCGGVEAFAVMEASMSRVLQILIILFRGASRTLLASLLCLPAALSAPQARAATALEEAAERYRAHLIEDIGRTLAGTQRMRDCMKANDLSCARKAWIEARVGWERSEVFTSGFVPELDQDIDAWPNATQGFHGVEARLFGAGRTDAHEETDALIARLEELSAQLRTIPLVPQRLLNGIARLAFEVGGNKADGGESRLSGTSLNDMQSNADGIELAYKVIFSDAIMAGDPKLADAVQATVGRLKVAVKTSELKSLDGEKLRADSEELVTLLQIAAPKIGLGKPTLEETAQ
jgi:iron uptake system EfeUOB component EfeO/EfeM